MGPKANSQSNGSLRITLKTFITVRLGFASKCAAQNRIHKGKEKTSSFGRFNFGGYVVYQEL